jgi:hypothetical protein
LSLNYKPVIQFIVRHINFLFNFSAIINKQIRMNKLLLALLAICLLGSCKSKHSKGKGDEFNFEDFKELFSTVQLPYKLTTDSLKKSIPDSLALTPELMKQFLTDTLARAEFHEAPVKFFPLSYFEGGDMKFFVVKVVGKAGTRAYLCFADKKGKYLNSMVVAKTATGNVTQYCSVDTRMVVKVTEEKLISAGRTSTREDFFSVSPEGKTALIMTNSTGEAAPGQIFNPIESLPKKNKFSGDYESGQLSIVSIRDGNDAKTFQFFISFSKENTGCKGEISGTGHLTAANKGEYQDKETDCGISFQFSSAGVTIKEIGGCGAYRGIRCFFDGNFKKK